MTKTKQTMEKEIKNFIHANVSYSEEYNSFMIGEDYLLEIIDNFSKKSLKSILTELVGKKLDVKIVDLDSKIILPGGTEAVTIKDILSSFRERGITE